MLCNQCDCLIVNNIKCHEIGCPNAWKDEIKKCKWCNSNFSPYKKDQEFCCQQCCNDDYNA